MTRRFVSARDLLLASACLFLTAAAPTTAGAQQGWPSAESSDPLAGTTRKLDDYGKIGHCDETARLDNFAITLQNEPGSKGYLLVYVGKKDLLAWTGGILEKAAGYLVNSRGIDASRLKVVNAGYREERTTELWVVPDGAPPPESTNTVEVRHDRTKAYQWDEDRFNVEFTPDSVDEESEEEEEGPAEAEGEAVAGNANAEAAAEGAEPGGESEAEEQQEAEKYEIAIVERGVMEYEPESESEIGGAAADAAASGQTPEGEETAPPEEGEVKISLWWNVERMAEELKTAPGSRVCLVYYWDTKISGRENVRKLMEAAAAKTVAQLGLTRERIVLIDGGRSKEPGVEVWVLPPGAEPPKPKPEKGRDFGFYSGPGED